MKARRLTFSELPTSVREHIDRGPLFASSRFARLWLSDRGHDVYWLVESDNSPLAVMTAVEFGARPVRRLQAMPDGLYCHVLPFPGSEAGVSSSASIIFEAVASENYSKIFVQDFHREFEEPQGFEVTQCETNLVDIADPEWEPPDAKIRSEIRKAGREGIQVIPFDPGKHFDSFISLMEQTERRHDNAPRYSPAFFAALAELSRSDERIYWAHVEVDGRAAASHIYLIDGDMALNWQVYFDKEFSWLKPNQYILYDTAKKCRERGIRTINLGASPGDAEGLAVYKEKWGGITYKYPCYHRTSLIGKLL